MTGVWLGVLGLLFGSMSVNAAAVQFEVVINEETTSRSLGTSVEYFEDETGSYSLDDIRETTLAERWVKSTKKVPNFGFSSSAYWFRFKVTNGGNYRFNGLLELGYPLLDYVDVYLLSAANEKKAMPDYILGDSKPFGRRVVAHRNFLIPLTMEAHDSLYAYIRVETGSATQLPLTIWEDQAFYKADANWLMIQGMFYGVMLIMALYNLFVFVAIRDISYFYYVCYVVGFSCVMSAIQGLGFQYVWSDSLVLQDKVTVYSMLFAILAVLVFTDRFLSLETRSVRLHKTGTLLGMSLAAAGVLAAILPYALSIQIAVVLVLMCGLYCMGAGILISSKGFKEAKYYTVAWSVLIVAIIVLALNKLGFVPRNIWTENMGQVGAAIEVTLLSLALADRINRERSETLQAQDEALHQEREARVSQQKSVDAHKQAEEELSEKVKDRTVELESALEDLSIANRKLKEISTIDGLTGVRNRRYFDLMVLKEFQKCRESESPLTLMMLDIDHFKSLNDEYGHLCGDECLRAIASVINDTVKWPTDGVARYGGEEFVVLLPETQLEGAKLLAEKIRSRVESKVWDIGGQKLNATISIGIAALDKVADKDSPDQLLALADEALYKAKGGGRNQVCAG